MSDQYHINTGAYSLKKFRRSLESRDMIPSRVSLKDDLGPRFDLLERQGLTTLKDLIQALKSKPDIQSFSNETGLPEEYLTLLAREARSFLPNPVRLDKFPGIPLEYLKTLESAGVKNTRQLFKAAARKKNREGLAGETRIPHAALTELVCLSDLSRVYGIGPAFARILYDAGVISIGAFLKHTASDLIHIYEEKEAKKADFGVNEIQFSLDLACDLEIALEI